MRLRGGARSSNKLGYFPDKSIEKAAEHSLAGVRRFGESYHLDPPERTAAPRRGGGRASEAQVYAHTQDARPHGDRRAD